MGSEPSGQRETALLCLWHTTVEKLNMETGHFRSPEQSIKAHD